MVVRVIFPDRNGQLENWSDTELCKVLKDQVVLTRVTIDSRLQPTFVPFASTEEELVSLTQSIKPD